MKPASKFEIVATRCWNVLNEGKSFHPVFVLRIFFLLHVFKLGTEGSGDGRCRRFFSPLR